MKSCWKLPFFPILLEKFLIDEPPENIVKEGQSLIDEKKFTEALSFINNHLTDYPKSITFNNFLGLLALSDNNFDDAKVYFDKALYPTFLLADIQL